MMKRVYLFLMLGVMQACVQQAQTNSMAAPAAANEPDVPKQIYVRSVNETDAGQTKKGGGPLKIAHAHKVDWNLSTAGQWERKANEWVWVLLVEAESASTLSFKFDDVNLSKNAQLQILNKNDEPLGGQFSAKHNKAHKQLWTGEVTGNVATIRLTMPHSERAQNSLRLSRVHTGLPMK